jgi:hypothetical protein
LETQIISFNPLGEKDPYGAAVMPIYQTATFAQPSANEFGAYDYTRSGNPTRDALQMQIAQLEGLIAAGQSKDLHTDCIRTLNRKIFDYISAVNFEKFISERKDLLIGQWDNLPAERLVQISKSRQVLREELPSSSRCCR